MTAQETLQQLQQLCQQAGGPENKWAGWWFNALYRHRWALLLPVITFFVLSAVYAVFGPKQWRAAQVFNLRDETIGRQNRPGSFGSLDDMKSAQETVLAIARNPAVLKRTLQRLGPSNGARRANWPSDSVIEDTQSAVQVSATNGAELGKTELIQLSVTANSRNRAEKFAEILCQETEAELRNVRYDRACSMQAELDKAVESAQTSLTEIAAEIEKFEQKLGPDLAELRNMIEPKTGDILLYHNLGQIQSELRAAQSNLETAQKQQQLLIDASSKTLDVLSTPNDLMNLMPSIRRLKDGLVDAQ